MEGEIWEEKKEQERRWRFWGQSPSHTASHIVRNKERYTRIEIDKSPEAKSRWDNLKLGKTVKK